MLLLLRARRPCSLLLLQQPDAVTRAWLAAGADAGGDASASLPAASSSTARPASSSSASPRHRRPFSAAAASSPEAAAQPPPADIADADATSATTTTEYMEFPGGRVPFTMRLRFVAGVGAPRDANPDTPCAVLPSWPCWPGGSSRSTGSAMTAPPPRKLPCYRTLDATGAPIPGADAPYDHELLAVAGAGAGVAAAAPTPTPTPTTTAERLYRCMARLQTMDALFYEAQRQGRFSFYMTSAGEEATVVGAAAALSADDPVLAQYREQGALMWRGYAPREFALQCFGSALDPAQGRQMPIHYGSAKLRYHTISSPLATQLPQAVGAAYAMRARGEPRVAAAFFGEGASSEGDFHAALNFAATLGSPTLFICRNNGYAISTPAAEQYAGDGVAARGPAYGVPAVRVDGGDARAVFNAVSAARALALARGGPVLVEAMSYRAGHHSTSDDSSRYRSTGEMAAWRARDPVVRLRNWLSVCGGTSGWDAEREAALRAECRAECVAALEEAARAPMPSVSSMFDDVYAEVPWHLREQREEVLEFARRHKDLVPPGVAVE
jgi:2-oxoisovalerate dehydrogenase E1 component alpha subunit